MPIARDIGKCPVCGNIVYYSNWHCECTDRRIAQEKQKADDEWNAKTTEEKLDWLREKIEVANCHIDYNRMTF